MRPRGTCVQRPPEVRVSERRGGRPAASEPDPARDARRGPRRTGSAGLSSRWPPTTAPRSCSTTRSTSATRSTSRTCRCGPPTARSTARSSSPTATRSTSSTSRPPTSPSGLETVDEVRPALAWFYLYSGENLAEWVERWAVELVATLRERRRPGELRLAVDRLDPPGTDALRRHGVTLVEGQELTEHARLIKSPDEIALMRWTIRVCEAGMARMHELSVDGPDRAGDLGRAPPREHPLGRRVDRDAAAASPASAPTRGTRSARTTSPGEATCWPSTPT